MLSLIERQRHGYSIIQDIAERTAGEVILGTSTLYAAINRMVAAGLLQEGAKPPDADSDDPRRRYYQATQLGLDVAREEALRIKRLGNIVAQTELLDRELVPRRAGDEA